MEKEVAHLPPGEGRRSLWVLGELLTYKIPSQRIGGAYALFEIGTPPGSGPPPHVQHREDESFYVLEGEFEFSSGDESARVGAGSLLYVPKGVLHAHENVGEGVGRVLARDGRYCRHRGHVRYRDTGTRRPIEGRAKKHVQRSTAMEPTHTILVAKAYRLTAI